MLLHHALRLSLLVAWRCIHGVDALPFLHFEDTTIVPTRGGCTDINRCSQEACSIDALEDLEDAESNAVEIQLLQTRTSHGRHDAVPSVVSMHADVTPPAKDGRAKVSLQAKESESTGVPQFFQVGSETQKHPHTKTPTVNDGTYSLEEAWQSFNGSTDFLYQHSLLVVLFAVTTLLAVVAVLSTICLNLKHCRDRSSQDAGTQDGLGLDQLLAHRGFDGGTLPLESPPSCPNGGEVEVAVVGLVPPKKLAHVGTSFVVPLSSGETSVGKCVWPPESSGKLDVSFDIPVWPAAWPLKACLFRESATGPWERIEVTHDIIAAVGMPPLLWCKPAAEVEADCGSTGGIGTGIGGDTTSPSRSYFEVHDGTRGVVATLRPQQDGQLFVTRTNLPSWQVETQPAGLLGNVITVRRNGQEIGMAMEIDSDKIGAEGGVYLQVDTAAAPDSPEAAQILVCILTMMAFNLMK